MSDKEHSEEIDDLVSSNEDFDKIPRRPFVRVNLIHDYFIL